MAFGRFMPKDERHAPTLGINAEFILILIDVGQRPTGEGDELIVNGQTAVVHVGIGNDAPHDQAADAALFILRFHVSAERGVIAFQTGRATRREIS